MAKFAKMCAQWSLWDKLDDGIKNPALPDFLSKSFRTTARVGGGTPIAEFTRRVADVAPWLPPAARCAAVAAAPAPHIAAQLARFIRRAARGRRTAHGDVLVPCLARAKFPA